MKYSLTGRKSQSGVMLLEALIGILIFWQPRSRPSPGSAPKRATWRAS
jgi:hypothetical protein